MAAARPKPLSSLDIRKTYLYLRIGMIGAVVLLAASIGIERSKVGCFQTSISAYYYTPVRAIFVGFLIAVGLSLIVYKGRTTLEDASLNFAGMLAPVVAVAPTTDVGSCWLVAPIPLPVMEDGSLANWVVTNIDNNFYALLIAGAVGLAVSLIIALAERDDPLFDRWTWVPLVFAFLLMVFGWWLIENWGDFYTRTHGWAAVFMIAFLGVAIIAHAIHHRRKGEKGLSGIYLAIAALMALGGILIPWTRVFDEHTVFALEAYEIGLFAIYWIVQTKENWKEDDLSTESVPPVAGGGGGHTGE
jgi:hypothetical protein